MIRILARLEDDLHRHALHHLHVVAGGVLGRQQAELRAGRRRDAVDVPLERPCRRARRRRRSAFWPGRIVRELRLLEVRGDPDVARDRRAPAAAGPAGPPVPARPIFRLTTPAVGRLDGGVLEVQLRLRQRGFRLLHARLGRGGARFGDLQLLRRGLRVVEAGARLRRGAARLRGALLGDGDRRPARPRRPTSAASAAARAESAARDRGVELLLRDLVLLRRARAAARRRAPPGPRSLPSRAGAPAPRPGCACATSISCSAPATAASACSTPPEAVRHAGAGLDARDRHAGPRGRRGRLGVGQLRLRAIDRDLVVARIDLRRARRRPSTAWLLSTCTLITVPPTRAAICVMCPSTCASSVDSLPRERQPEDPGDHDQTSRTTPPMRQRPPLPPVFDLLGFIFGLLLRHYCRSSEITSMTADSAMPSARASEALARLCCRARRCSCSDAVGDRFLRLRDLEVAGDARARSDRAPASSCCVGELACWSAPPGAAGPPRAGRAAPRGPRTRRGPEVLELRLALPQRRIRLSIRRAVVSPAVEDRNADRGGDASRCCARRRASGRCAP